jgi:hypothetical protein
MRVIFRLIPRCLLPLITVSVVGCTFTVHRPLPELHQKMLEWSGQKYNGSSAHAVKLVKLPAATYLYSTNETLGVGEYGHIHTLSAFTFQVRAAHRHFLTVNILTDGPRCRILQPTYDAMAAATQAAFSRLETRFVPTGSLDLILTRDGPYFANQTYTLHFGRNIELELYFPCEDGVEEVANVSSLLSAMHELTHIIYRLHSKIPAGASQEEITADDAPACVYEELQKSPAGDALWNKFPPDAYYHDSFYYGHDIAHPQTAEACNRWVRTIQNFVSSN